MLLFHTGKTVKALALTGHYWLDNGPFWPASHVNAKCKRRRQAKNFALFQGEVSPRCYIYIFFSGKAALPTNSVMHSWFQASRRMQTFFVGFMWKFCEPGSMSNPCSWVPWKTIVNMFCIPFQFSMLWWAQWNAPLDEDWVVAQNALYIGPFYKKEWSTNWTKAAKEVLLFSHFILPRAMPNCRICSQL